MASNPKSNLKHIPKEVMSTEDQSRKTKKGRTEKRRRKESGSLLVWVLRTGRSSMVEPARAYNYPATIESFFAPHKPHHHNKVATVRMNEL